MLIAIKKCKFYITKTKFCGFIIKLKKLSINPKKVKVIVKDRKSVVEGKSVLGEYLDNIIIYFNSEEEHF